MLTQYAFSILFIDKKKAKFSNDRFGLKSVLAAARIATVEMAVAEQLEGKGALAAAVSTTIYKTAIRGLMIATDVGAAIALLTMGIEALVNWLDNSSDSSEEAAAGMKKTFRQMYF